MSSEFEAAIIEDPVVFQKTDAANTLVGFFFVTVCVFMLLYTALKKDKPPPSAYSKVIHSFNSMETFVLSYIEN